MNKKLILTSYGLTTGIGRKLISKELKAYDLADKKIFLFHEPHYSVELMLIEACLNLRFKKGNKIYIGCSAGAAIAGVSIEEVKDFDRNFIGMVDFGGLNLFDGIIIPHYTKSEFRRYISNSPGIEEKYNRILSISNEKSLVLEV